MCYALENLLSCIASHGSQNSVPWCIAALTITMLDLAEDIGAFPQCIASCGIFWTGGHVGN